MRNAWRPGIRCATLFGWTLCCVAPIYTRADTIRAEVELTTKDIGSKETVVGDLVADAIRASAKADAAFVPASSFADVVIPKGSVTTADVLRTLDGAYKSDTIVVLKLTGEQISKALEQSLYIYPSSFNGFLSLSGLSATVNENADRERRVTSIKIGGDALEPTKVYHVAMPQPLADGAYMYFKIWKRPDTQKDSNKTVESALSTYLTDHKTISKGEERVVFKAR